MDAIEGGCLCGAVRYRIEEEAQAALVCHCTHCQKQSGSAFSTILGVAESAFSIEGEPCSYADAGEEVTYRIVGEDEADPKQGMISVTSPVARALMNKQVDDEVIVKAPKGDRELEILNIRFD